MAEKVKKNFQLLDAYTIYTGLVGIENSNKTLPFSFSFKIDDLKKIFFTHADRYEKERTKFLTEFGKQTSENSFDIPKENVVTLNEKIEELNAYIVSDIEFEPFQTSYLYTMKDLQVPAGVIPAFRTLGVIIE